MVEKPLLSGERVVLRPITEADAADMFASLFTISTPECSMSTRKLVLFGRV